MRGANKTENIDVGYDVLMDDFFQTGEDGQIGIIFEDDTSVTVIENSELLIDDFVYDPASGNGQLAFNVTVGSFRYVSGALAANNAGAVKITTPSATITVRGTTLTGNVTPGGATTITLLRDRDGGLGMVNVANRAGSVNLTQTISYGHSSLHKYSTTITNNTITGRAEWDESYY